MIPEGLCARIPEANVRVLPIFDLIAETGKISRRDMFNTFNMGVGMCLVVSPKEAEKALEILRANGEDAYLLGEITEGERRIELC